MVINGQLKQKSFDFAKRIVKLYSYLCNDKKETVMSKQLFRSGTSIGANISESKFACSKADFESKMQIALKEAGETEYWLELLFSSGFLSEVEYKGIIFECDELIKLLVASLKTSKEIILFYELSVIYLTFRSESDTTVISYSLLAIRLKGCTETIYTI